MTERRWEVKTNRHPETSGRAWGWIEGHPDHLCWSDDKEFNYKAACALVNKHNLRLEDE